MVLFPFTDAANLGGCSVAVDADVVGVEDATIFFCAFVSQAAGVFAADDDHRVALVEGGCCVLNFHLPST